VENRSLVVNGMTCDHCASAVRAEVGALPGVTGVDVDVAGGTVVVHGEPVPGDDRLREAIQEAGYELAG
jgi:copper chaperone CopZ